MKKHRIEIDPLAEEDMLSCFDYISLTLKNPMAALSMLDEIEKKYDLLEATPLMGTEYITESGKLYRYIIVGNYKMFYTLGDGVLTIRRYLYAPSNFSHKLDFKS